MTDHARVWWVRVTLLVGLGWFVIQLALHRSFGEDIIFGRYSPRYFNLLLPGIGVSAVIAILALRPELRRFVLANRFRRKMIVFAAWLPLWIASYGVSHTLVPAIHKPRWDAAFIGLFGAVTLAMVLASLDALRVAVRRPEFWISTVSVILTLGLVEGAMRFWIRNLEEDPWKRKLYDPALTGPAQLLYQPHHYEGYIPSPGWTSSDNRDRHNSLGYRGEEIDLPKPPGVYRIVALGGSTTYGTGVSSWQDAYPAQLERVLRNDYGYTSRSSMGGWGGTIPGKHWSTWSSVR